MGLDLRGAWSLYFGKENTGPAISFSHGSDSGQYEWVQVVTLTSSERDNATTTQHRVGNGLDVVEADIQYNDSPGEILDYSWPHFHRADWFTMYLMYRPTSSDVWVPLYSLDWNWSGDAYYNSGSNTWSGGGSSSTQVTFVRTTGYPSWTQMVADSLIWQ
jgi:hypothetical protein